MSIREQDAARIRLLGVTDAHWKAIQGLHRKRGGSIAPDMRRFLDGLAAIEQYRGVIGERLDQAVGQASRQMEEYLAHGLTDSYYDMTEATIEAEKNSGLGVRCHLSVILYTLQGLFDAIGRDYPVVGPRVAERCKQTMNVVFLDLYSLFGAYQQQMAAEVTRRGEAIDGAIDTFRQDMQGLTQVIVEAQTQVESASGETATAVRSAVECAEGTSTELGAAARDFVTTAAAADELAASIQDIDTAVSASLDAVRSAVEQTDTAQKQVTGLVQAVESIGAVAGLIQAIAEQTNLLALNATIEAARAGEAGRGFAVVASEVKALANQTAQATKDIGERIAAIQDGVTRSAGSISAVSQELETSARMAETIGVAMRQQRNATTEIAEMMQKAVTRANLISESSEETRRIIASSAGTSDELRKLAGELGAQTAGLTNAVERFSQRLHAI